MVNGNKLANNRARESESTNRLALFEKNMAEHNLNEAYNDLQLAFCDERREKENIYIYFNVTNKEALDQIQRCGYLKGDLTKHPYFAPLAKAEHIPPRGVWFCATLYRGALPDQSPYGRRRIKIPCQTLLESIDEPVLYLESLHSYESSPNIQYVRLILLDRNSSDFQFCNKHCIYLDMVHNPFLSLDVAKKEYRCVRNAAWSKPNVWVEVLVVGDVHLIHFDRVKEAPRSSEKQVKFGFAQSKLKTN